MDVAAFPIHGLLNWSLIIACVAVMQYALWRRSEEGPRLLRQSLQFAALTLGLYLLAMALRAMDAEMGASLSLEIATLLFGLLLIRIGGLFLFRVALPFVRLPQARINEDILLVLAYFGWGLVRLRVAGLDLSGLVTTSAVLTAVLAFAMQDTLGSILGGLALQLDKSVRIGDWIKVDEVRGRVLQVQWRHTAIRTNNGEIVILPNSVLTKSKLIVFSSQESPEFRRWIPFAVGFNIPPQQVIDTVEKALCEAQIHHVEESPSPQCIITDYRDGSTHYAVRYWLKAQQFDDGVDSVIRAHVYTALQRQGFVLANPCLDVNLSTETDVRHQQRHEEEMQKRLRALRQVNLFSILSSSELQQLAASLRGAPFTREDVITRQGAIAHWLYLLVEGEACVYHENGDKERRLLATLQAGQIFGEMGLMTGAPRRATVVAKTDAFCYRLDKDSFENILRARPDLAEEFARVLGERNQDLNNLRHDGVPNSQTQQASLVSSIRKFFGLS